MRQTFLAISDQAVAGGTNFLTIIAIGRWCGPEALGVFGLALTIVYLLIATQDSLITTPYTVFFARVDEASRPRYRANTLLSHLALSTSCAMLFLAAALVSFLLNLDRQFTYVVASIALVGPCWLLREFARRSVYAEFHLRFGLAITLTVMIVQAIGLVGLAGLGRLSPVTGFLAVAFANLSAGVAWYLTTRGSMEFARGGFLSTLQKHWRLGKLMSVGQIVHTLTSHSLAWLTALWLGTSAAGILIACEQVVRLANPLMVGLMNILMPRTAHAFAEDGRPGLHHIVQRAMMMYGIFMTAFSAAVILLGSQILDKLFGTEYGAYNIVLIVLVIAKTIEAISIGPSRGLIVLERVGDCLKAVIVHCLITLATTLVLVWHLGILGAAFGALIGSVVYTAALVGLYWRAASM